MATIMTRYTSTSYCEVLSMTFADIDLFYNTLLELIEAEKDAQTQAAEEK